MQSVRLHELKKEDYAMLTTIFSSSHSEQHKKLLLCALGHPQQDINILFVLLTLSRIETLTATQEQMFNAYKMLAQASEWEPLLYANTILTAQQFKKHASVCVFRPAIGRRQYIGAVNVAKKVFAMPAYPNFGIGTTYPRELVPFLSEPYTTLGKNVLKHLMNTLTQDKTHLVEVGAGTGVATSYFLQEQKRDIIYCPTGPCDDFMPITAEAKEALSRYVPAKRFSHVEEAIRSMQQRNFAVACIWPYPDSKSDMGYITQILEAILKGATRVLIIYAVDGSSGGEMFAQWCYNLMNNRLQGKQIKVLARAGSNENVSFMAVNTLRMIRAFVLDIMPNA